MIPPGLTRAAEIHNNITKEKAPPRTQSMSSSLLDGLEPLQFPKVANSVVFMSGTELREEVPPLIPPILLKCRVILLTRSKGQNPLLFSLQKSQLSLTLMLKKKRQKVRKRKIETENLQNI